MHVGFFGFVLHHLHVSIPVHFEWKYYKHQEFLTTTPTPWLFNCAGQGGAFWNKAKQKKNCQERFGNAVPAKKLLESTNTISFPLVACIASVPAYGFAGIHAKLTWKGAARRSRCLAHVMVAVDGRFNLNQCLMVAVYQTIQKLWVVFLMKGLRLVGQPKQMWAEQLQVVWSISLTLHWQPWAHQGLLNLRPDCGSRAPAFAMVLCGKTSPALTGLDKGDEIINKTLPLLVSANTMDKKAMLQIVFLCSSVSSQQTQCFMATSCELCSPQTFLPLHKALVSLQSLLYLTLWSAGWCKRRTSGPSSILDSAWDDKWHFYGPAVHWELWTMVSQQIPIKREVSATVEESICVCVSIQTIQLPPCSAKHNTTT